MKRILLALLLLGLVFAQPVMARTSCTQSGTSGSDNLKGTDHHDVQCAFGGPDYANGRAGADKVRGGPGSDTLIGGNGKDILQGGRGNDDLFATDGLGGDYLDSGPGRDNCYGDDNDAFDPSCEHVVKV
jgi:Ca2+-binding RTX toxin-like protein